MKSRRSFWLTFLFILLIFSIDSFKSYCAYPEPIRSDTLQLAEKIYLHIDRVNYTSGDDIWFRAYVIDPSTNKLSTNTNNLHVEFISPDNQISLSRIVRIQNGTGYGDFSLSDSIASGHYRIRAYTNSMRNYDKDFFFQKEITIINPFDNIEALKPRIQKIENKIDINFFPEGGSLVENVTSKVAFKAVNVLGFGCDVTLKLYSSTGDLITTFNSTHLGMGYFNIKPVSGFNYYIVAISKDGAEKKVPLPVGFQKGVVLRTIITSDRKLILTISTNEETLPLILGKDLSVNLSHRNLVNKTTSIRINSLINYFSIPLDSIPDGILRITLSVPNGLPLCERLVYLEKQTNATLVISTDKSEYKPREKVIAKISLTGDPSFSGVGEFSFSAAEERYTDISSPYPRSIASWFLLESDVRGPIEQPSYYFDLKNKNRLQELDLLLLTQGWRDFKWKYNSIQTFDNEVGFTLSGNLKRILNNNPIDGAEMSLGLFSDNSTEFFSTRTDNKGLFKFGNLDIIGTAQAYISSKDQGKVFIDHVRYKPPEIEFINPDTIQLSLIESDFHGIQQEANFMLNNLKKYKLNDTLNIGEVFITAERKETPQEVRVRESRKIYTIPDKEIVITPAQENYAGDVFSFISGRLGGLRVVRGVDPCNIYYPDDAEVYIREQFIIETKKCNNKEIKIRRGALVLLDGYEINPENLVSILTLPMYIVDRVDVLNASPLFGMRGANGAVNIITKTGIRRDIEKQSVNSAIVILKGFDVPRIFYSPKYDNQVNQTFIPDYRSTIFWKPDIRIEKRNEVRLDFYNADEAGTIKLIVEGVSAEGIPVSGKAEYTVK
jgi:hypothetical protein